MIKKLSNLYLWALMPSTLLAAESIMVNEEVASIIPALMQGGIGGIVGLIAVKMLLVLYNDKEKNSTVFHDKLLEVIQSQSKLNQELIASNQDVLRTLNEVKINVLENRQLFTTYIKNQENNRR